MSQGPARGDLYFWNYETVDLAPYLVAGVNVIASVVWNEGRAKPESQISYLTGFIMQGNTLREKGIDTDSSWKVVKDISYRPLPVQVAGYYVAGPGEFVDMNKHVARWTQAGYDDSKWLNASIIAPGTPKVAAVNTSGWMLVPSPLPQMEMTIQRLSTARKAEGVVIPAGFPGKKTAVVIAANTKATILLDQGFLTNAYPTLSFSGGKNASLTMEYAESLYVGSKAEALRSFTKSNRNEVDGKVFIGRMDSLISDGSQNQEYTPLSWRTYRYVQLKVVTKGEGLTLNDIYGTFTGYPFIRNSEFTTDNASLTNILDVGWRTARLCAFETYMDCPYYEQLQYIGDARIQALISYYNSGDDRLARNAITLMDHSRIAEGITQSRYPTDLKQEIPTFSLWWIGMVHDYYRYRNDPTFVKGKLSGIRQVLSFFESYQQYDGSLKDVPYWVFTDWVESNGWDFGMAPKGKQGESAVLDLTLLLAYRMAGEL
ncbi:MAG TPA: alpha-rhamnosidase, partial [Chitinophagaceae bacterium]|nr:alpha-rhamnosidase [Chitinophagaceae bacterium]